MCYKLFCLVFSTGITTNKLELCVQVHPTVFPLPQGLCPGFPLADSLDTILVFHQPQLGKGPMAITYLILNKT